jgi:hypothetical protein
MGYMKITLASLPNKSLVTVGNTLWGDEDENKVCLQLNGILEKSQEAGEDHYVRCPELQGELNGISFSDKHVAEIERLPSGRIHIVLAF